MGSRGDEHEQLPAGPAPAVGLITVPAFEGLGCDHFATLRRELPVMKMVKTNLACSDDRGFV
jgi:hypothetical protein